MEPLGDEEFPAGALPAIPKAEMAQDVAAPPTSEGEEGCDVFISYARADRELVERLRPALQERGRTAWVDWQDIPPTAQWMLEIREAIDGADTFVAVLSPDWVRSRVCAEELEFAVSANKRIVPLVTRDTAAADVPAEVAKLNWLFIRESDDLDEAVDTLVSVMDTDLAQVKLHTHLLVRSREWERAGEPASKLLRGDDLEEAEAAFIAGREIVPTELQSRYVTASRRGATSRQRMLVTAISAALVITLGLGAIALVQRNKAVGQERVAESGRLAALAESQLQIDPEVALLLSLRSLAVAETAASERALRRSLLASHLNATLLGHSNPVLDASFSSDGTIAMTRSDWIPVSGFPPDSHDYSVRLWDPASGRALGDVEMDSRIVDAEFDPEGEHIIVAGSGGELVVGEQMDGDRVASEDVGERIDEIAVAAGGHVVALGDDASTRVWSVGSNEIEIVPASPFSGLSVLAVADGARIATAGAEGIAIWEPRMLDRLTELPVPFALETLSADARGSRFLVSDGDSLAVVERGRRRPVASWDLPMLGALDLETRTPSASPVISADGRTAATARDDGQISLWDASSGELLSTFSGHVGEVTSLEFGSDDSRLLSSGIDQQAIVWDVGTGEQVATFRGHQGPVFGAGFSPDGKQIVTAGFDRSARVWQVELNAPIASVGPGSDLQSQAVGFSSDGSRLATGSVGGAALWDPQSGDRTLSLQMAAIDKEDRWTVGAAFSPSDRILATVHLSGHVRLWDVASGAQVMAIKMPEGEGPGTADAQKGLENAVWAAAFSPDGTRIATASQDGLARVWDASTGRLIASCSGHGSAVNSVAWSPDGSKLATVSDDGTLRIWSVEPCASSIVLRGHTGPVFSVDWSSGGSPILSAGVDATVVMWDASDGSVIRTLRGHTDIIINADLAGDGRYYATASWDGTIRVWEVASGDVVAELRGPGDQPTQVAFDPRGHYLAVGTYDRETKGFLTELYDCVTCADLQSLVSVARDRVTRDLSREEEDQFGLS